MQALQPIIRKSPSPIPEPHITTDTKISSSTKVYEPIITRDTQISKVTTDDNEISEEITSKTEVSTLVETKVTQESKTIKLERKTPEFLEPFLSSREEKHEEYKSEILPITYEIRTKSPIVVSEDDSGIQTTSITKQSSLDYFVKKMKESEEPAKPKELTQRPESIKQEIYTKFEDVSRREKKLEPIKYEQKIEPPKPLPPMPQFTPLPPLEPLPHVQEQSYKSHVEKSFTSSSSSAFQHHEKSSFNQTNLKPEPPAEICYTAPMQEFQKQQHISSKIKQLESHREISQSEAPIGGVKILPSQKRAPLIQPQPKFEPLPKIEPIAQLPPKEFATFMEPTSSVKTESKYESSHYHHESSGSILRPYEMLQTRPLSPRPSAEGVEMEKLWVPHKPQEPPSYSSSYTVEKETIEPRLGGISMEKAWAHKSMESHHKSWPPVPETPQVPPSYSVQSTLERKWTPSVKETHVKESTIIEQHQKQQKMFSQEVQPSAIPPQPVQHYIAKVSKLEEQQYLTTVSESSKQDIHQEYKYEESAKPSEIIKAWPPKKEEIPSFKPSIALPVRPISVQDITNEVVLEPGTPPEILYAQPSVKKTQIIEQTQYEKVIEVVPPPLPPKQQQHVAPPLPIKSYKYVEPPRQVEAPRYVEPPKKFVPPKKVVDIPSKPFERFPDLEPFPFKPDASQPRPQKVGPPPTPSKFIMGRFVDSDYESDIESVKIPPKWKPFSSDTDEPSYRRVQAPRVAHIPRSRSIEKEPLPPSQFERPPQFDGPPRPQINFQAATKEIRSKEMFMQQQQEQVKRYTHKISRHETRKEPSPPPLKPGSPPVFMHAEKKPKPESPKAKLKFVQDGYMADTDEPFRQQQQKFSTKEERTEHKIFQQIDQQPKIFHQRKHFAASKKVCRFQCDVPINSFCFFCSDLN